MGWFTRKDRNSDLKKNTSLVLASPVDGEVVLITEVPDEVFASKMMGDGFSVNPTNGTIVSPVNGKVTFIADTKHGIGLTSDHGLELIIHMGIVKVV